MHDFLNEVEQLTDETIVQVKTAISVKGVIEDMRVDMKKGLSKLRKTERSQYTLEREYSGIRNTAAKAQARNEATDSIQNARRAARDVNTIEGKVKTD